jgi:hypothetical protein
MIRILRELNIIVYILSHSYEDLPPAIKSNIAILVVCKGFNNSRLISIHNTANTGVDFQQFK